MPFRIEKRDKFRYQVKVKQARDSGKLEEFEFTALFHWKDQEEIRALMATPLADLVLIEKVWAGWPEKSGLEMIDSSREGGDVPVDMPDTPANRQILLRQPGVIQGLIHAWMDAAVYGPAKN